MKDDEYERVRINRIENRILDVMLPIGTINMSFPVTDEECEKFQDIIKDFITKKLSYIPKKIEVTIGCEKFICEQFLDLFGEPDGVYLNNPETNEEIFTILPLYYGLKTETYKSVPIVIPDADDSDYKEKYDVFYSELIKVWNSKYFFVK